MDRTARSAKREWGTTDLVVALRWAGLTLSVLAMVASRPTRHDVIGAGMLAVYAVLRTVWPLRLDLGYRRRATEAALDTLLCAGVAGWTGLVASPFLLSLGASLLLAGLSVGPGVALIAAASAGAGVAVSYASGAFDEANRDGAAQRGALLALLCMLGACSRWLLRPQPDDQSEELERLRNLTEVNTLLLELHARAASLPGSISLRGVVTATVARLRNLLQPDTVLLLLRDPTAVDGGRPWGVAVAEGVSRPDSLSDDELPAVLRDAARSRGSLRRTRIAEGEGVGRQSSSGLYIPLWARESLVGLLAVERGAGRDSFDEADVDVVADVAQHAGLAIDNARWFRRLRTLGAEEERGRIARELHDRIGQTLAFVALSLDRVGLEVGTDTVGLYEIRSEIAALAVQVRAATGEVREKLSDLRMDTSEATDLEAALRQLLARVQERSGVKTMLDHDTSRRLAPIVEQEVWRIAQEAIINAERHAEAGLISVRWTCDETSGQLDVADDGKGTAATAPLRQDAFGLLGMRERADAIGASFALSSRPGEGTIVRLRIDT